jgi:RloB-like protein
VTEPRYFREMRHLERCPVDLDLPPWGAAHRTVVERAAEKKREAKSEAMRQRDQNLAYDEVWCVFAGETHPNLPEAMQQANDHGIHLAVSNPCFELRALLQFQEQASHVRSDQVTHLVRRHRPRYRKTLPTPVPARAIAFSKTQITGAAGSFVAWMGRTRTECCSAVGGCSFRC